MALVLGRFPALGSHNCAVTSPATPDYNCIAWAAGDESRWWDPDPMRQYYLPRLAPRVRTLDAYERAFAGLGYSPCISIAVESGLEKVAIFAAGDRPLHAARQLLDGMWTSKLGQEVDVRHELKAIEGQDYGVVARILARPRPA